MNTWLPKVSTTYPRLSMDFLGEAPVVYHCHHFNLYLDQTIDDALGPDEGLALRTRAARGAAYQLLSSVYARLGALSTSEKLEIAHELFQAMGQGRLELLGDKHGGIAHGEYLHYGFVWREKYGTTVRRTHPADAVAAGYAAGALAAIYDLPANAFDVTETRCYAQRAERCRFTLEPAESPGPLLGVAGRGPIIETTSTGLPGGRREERILTIEAGLRELLAGVRPDERGLVQAFGVFVTRHMANYYNRLAFDALSHVKARAPRVQPMLEGLLRESGHVCVFHTFGGILNSPEWEGLVGRPSSDTCDVIDGSVAIARALGFGRWTIEECDPGKRFSMRAPATYESAYYRALSQPSTHPVSYFMQGAAMAIMQLANAVDWSGEVRLDHDFYLSLFKKGVPWKVEQTRCTAMGDPFDEVVVTAL